MRSYDEGKEKKRRQEKGEDEKNYGKEKMQGKKGNETREEVINGGEGKMDRGCDRKKYQWKKQRKMKKETKRQNTKGEKQ